MRLSEGLHIAVFASGKGSNFKAILEAIEKRDIPGAEIVLVLSNNADAGALSIAREHSIPAVQITSRQFAGEDAYSKSLLEVLNRHRVNFIVLAGYMKIVPAAVIRAYRNRIVNIHPALLPAYGGKGMYGIHVHEAVLKNKAAVSGATVHLVDEEYDHGPIVLQEIVPVTENDTPESLAARVLELEHRLYPRAVALFAAGKVKIDGQHVTIIN